MSGTRRRIPKVWRKILDILWQGEGSLCASEIAARSDALLRTTVTPTLKKMEAEGLVEVDHIGRSGNVLVRKFRAVISTPEFYRIYVEVPERVDESVRAYVWSGLDREERERRITEIRSVLEEIERTDTTLLCPGNLLELASAEQSGHNAD